MSSVLRRTHFLYQNVLRLRIQVLFVRNDRLIYIKGNGESLSTFSVSVPRPGIEPGWVAPLVFETSASTDSAIWAIVCFSIASAKVMIFFICAKVIAFFLKKSCKCLPITAKRSNFASRLLSTHTMGERCFRSLSYVKDTI